MPASLKRRFRRLAPSNLVTGRDPSSRLLPSVVGNSGASGFSRSFETLRYSSRISSNLWWTGISFSLPPFSLNRISPARMASLWLSYSKGLKPAFRKFRSGAFIDAQLSPCARSALAKFLRVTEHKIKALELRQQFPTLPMEWILRSIDWDRFVEGRAMYAFCPVCIHEMSRRTQTVWIRSEWAFVFQTHCARHRTPLRETCAVCFMEDPLAIANPPARSGSLELASCWNCGSSLLLYDPDTLVSPIVAEMIELQEIFLEA
jgi:hypothetical protein